MLVSGSSGQTQMDKRWAHSILQSARLQFSFKGAWWSISDGLLWFSNGIDICPCIWMTWWVLGSNRSCTGEYQKKNTTRSFCQAAAANTWVWPLQALWSNQKVLTGPPSNSMIVIKFKSRAHTWLQPLNCTLFAPQNHLESGGELQKLLQIRYFHH